MSKQGSKNCLLLIFFEMRKVIKNIGVKEKRKYYFQKIIFWRGYGVLIFFLTNQFLFFGIFLPNIDGGWF